MNEYTAQSDFQQHERELAQRLEQRRRWAERAVQEHGGEHLAVVAHLARQARATRAVARPAGC